MELSIRPHKINTFPLTAVFINSPSVQHWIEEIQLMGCGPEDITAFAVPGLTANSVSGCLLLFNGAKKPEYIGKNNWCQQVRPNLFIPAYASLYPLLSEEELTRMFSYAIHFFHPVLGLSELEAPVDWQELIVLPTAAVPVILPPEASVHIPQTINSFQVREVAPEAALEAFEQSVVSQKEKLADQPLTALEKIKLSLLKTLFKKGDNVDGTASEQPSGIWQKLAALLTGGKDSRTMNKLKQDYEDLEERNKKEVDKLLDLLRKNPAEALKYAIPLDENGTARGDGASRFTLSKRWFDFSLFNLASSSTGTGGSAPMPADAFLKLQQQYNQTAQDLVKREEWEKAAFVYMKLLKNHYAAAQTLEQGHLYGEAASVYLKYVQNKAKAAECYEKGRMTLQAIELYKELGKEEKAGDLYMTINKKEEAYQEYQRVADSYSSSHQFVKASLIYKDKMDNRTAGQELLLKGWRSDRDAFNCLNNYFSNIQDLPQLQEAIVLVYKHDTSRSNSEKFLQAIKHEFNKHPEVQELTKGIAYEIIAQKIKDLPAIASELKDFNKEDPQIVKDIMRYKSDNRN